MHRHPQFSVVAADGELSAHSIAGLIDLCSMVPEAQPLVIDLRRVSRVDHAAAGALCEEANGRRHATPVAVVVDDPELIVDLAMQDVHLSARLAPTVAAAVTMVAGRPTGRPDR
ncbi:MAG TPA: STAS domain-containing protein [Ilumatobacteraceae bacterium]|nr:STAS domain-containing protein [Ilumatobacteraceae bacterium]